MSSRRITSYLGGVEKGRRGRSSLVLRVDNPRKTIGEMSSIGFRMGDVGTVDCLLLPAVMCVCSWGKFEARGVATGEGAVCPSSMRLVRVGDHNKSTRKRSDVPSTGWAYGQSSPSIQTPFLKRSQTCPSELISMRRINISNIYVLGPPIMTPPPMTLHVTGIIFRSQVSVGD
jgi:hypothetical protein